MPVDKADNVSPVPTTTNLDVQSAADPLPAWETPVLKRGDVLHRTLKVSWNTEHSSFSGLS